MMEILPLGGAKQILRELLDSDELGKTDSLKVEKIIKFIDSLEDKKSSEDKKRLNLSDILIELYGKDDKSALSSFRGFRKRLNEIAKELNIEFEFLVDNNKTKEPSKRLCFIKGNPREFKLNSYTESSLDN